MTTYNIYRNGNKIKSGLTEKNFKDTGLTPNTTYEYQVSAENSAGESPLSDKITITTEYSAPSSVEISPKTNNLEVGATRNLTATVSPETAVQTVSWSSSDDSIATIDATGQITAIGAGTATITATATNDVKGTATINVTETDPPEGES